MIIHGKEVKEKLLQGINLVADTVKPTLGPQAKTVILQGNPPIVINDGVTITKYIRHEDPYVQMGVQMVQNLASQAQDKSGDGTTTACVLAQALCSEIAELDISPHNMTKLMGNLKTVVLENLDSQKKEIEDNDILDVATIAANNDEYLGGLIQEAINAVGRDGIITVEESRNHETHLIVREGMEIDEGYVSHLMANNEEGTTVFENPLVFSSNLNIRKFNTLLPLLEIASGEGRPLLVFCKGIEGTALNNVIMNLLQGTVQVCIVTAPNFGDAQIDELGDIVATVGGRLYTDESNDDPTNAEVFDLGTCDKIIVSKETTTIIGGKGDVEERITLLKNTFENTEDKYVKARLKKRISILNGGVATIQIGASTEIQMRETKERLDDALNATKAALRSGIVVGGGVALFNVSLKSNMPPWFQNVLRKPLQTLKDNGGHSDDSTLRELLSKKRLQNQMALGYNALSDKYENLEECGVFDPVMVTKNSFLAAMSIAQLFHSTDVAVLLEE